MGGTTAEFPRRCLGEAEFGLETGFVEDGRRVGRTYCSRLRSDGGAVRAALGHERQFGGGRIAVQVLHVTDAGQVPGWPWTGAGVADRREW